LEQGSTIVDKTTLQFVVGTMLFNLVESVMPGRWINNLFLAVETIINNVVNNIDGTIMHLNRTKTCFYWLLQCVRMQNG
jgi:argininosuccinate synthase